MPLGRACINSFQIGIVSNIGHSLIHGADDGVLIDKLVYLVIESLPLCFVRLAARLIYQGVHPRYAVQGKVISAAFHLSMKSARHNIIRIRYVIGYYIESHLVITIRLGRFKIRRALHQFYLYIYAYLRQLSLYYFRGFGIGA